MSRDRVESFAEFAPCSPIASTRGVVKVVDKIISRWCGSIFDVNTDIAIQFASHDRDQAPIAISRRRFAYNDEDYSTRTTAATTGLPAAHLRNLPWCSCGNTAIRFV